MANRAEQTWKTLRQYKLRGIAIDEAADHIKLRQTNHVPWGRGMAWVVAAILGFFVPVFFRDTPIFGAVAVFFWLLFPFVVAPLLARYTKPEYSVNVRKGFVVITNGAKVWKLPVGEIRNIDVRGDGLPPIPKHFVTIWHGPVAIPNLYCFNQEDAMTLKEALVGAIAMMNREGIEQAQGTIAPKRHTFAE